LLVSTTIQAVPAYVKPDWNHVAYVRRVQQAILSELASHDPF
jgi:hypothetical protein